MLMKYTKERTFSAPRICTVDAGHLANDVNEPAFEISRAPTVSPISAARLGATIPICKRKESDFGRRVKYGDQGLNRAFVSATRKGT